ncbi:hypothetical protein [Bradyrhizobium sp. McL0615]|uniref:hypothetical protein n=1 Tax=Bradyrhizobium sp. McL0615 TaxID=3415673 RepID=UPI003CEFFCDF
MEGKTTREDVANGLSIFRAVAETFEEQVSLLLEGEPTEHDLAAALRSIKGMISVAHDYHHPPHTSKKPPRGIGHNKDDAMIVASLPWFDGMAEAIRAHHPKFGHDEVRNCAKRIREHQRAIDVANPTPTPWENSGNWLGEI